MLSHHSLTGEQLDEQHREQLQRLVQQPPVLEKAARFVWRALLRALAFGLLRGGHLLLNLTQPALEQQPSSDLLPLTSLPND